MAPHTSSFGQSDNSGEVLMAAVAGGRWQVAGRQLYGAGGADNKKGKKEREGRGGKKTEKREEKEEERKEENKSFNGSKRVLIRNLLR
jgi:hypothetical protein